MSDESVKLLLENWVLVVGQLVILASAVSAAIVSVITALRQGSTEAKVDATAVKLAENTVLTTETKAQIAEVKHQTNGLTSQLVVATERAAKAEGKVEGANEERAKIAEEKKPQ